METFCIKHPNGYIDVKIDEFFSCPDAKAKKLFRLARHHCSEEQRKELLSALVNLAKTYIDKIVETEKSLNEDGIDDVEFNRRLQTFKEMTHKRAQLALNIRILAAQKWF